MNKPAPEKFEAANKLSTQAASLADLNDTRKTELGLTYIEMFRDPELAFAAGYKSSFAWAKACFGRKLKMAERQAYVIRQLVDADRGIAVSDLKEMPHCKAYELSRIVTRVPREDVPNWVDRAKDYDETAKDFKAAVQAILDEKPDHIEKSKKYMIACTESQKDEFKHVEDLAKKVADTESQGEAWMAVVGEFRSTYEDMDGEVIESLSEQEQV